MRQHAHLNEDLTYLCCLKIIMDVEILTASYGDANDES